MTQPRWVPPIHPPLAPIPPRQCAEQVGCELHVVRPLPARDAAGVPYTIGLDGEHQRANAALALELCRAWVRARRGASWRGAMAGGMMCDTTGREPGSPEGGPASAPPGGSPGPAVAQEFSTSEGVHRGLRECSWPGRCQACGFRRVPSHRLCWIRIRIAPGLSLRWSFLWVAG